MFIFPFFSKIFLKILFLGLQQNWEKGSAVSMTQYMHSLPHYQHRSSEYFFPRDKPTLIYQSYPKSTVYFQFSSVAQSCLTLCDPMNHSTSGLPVQHQLPEFTQTHVSCPLSWWCHPAISSSVVSFSSCPQSLLASGSFPMSQLFAWGGQSIGVSASASVLPKNTQDWSSGWTGWISLQSKGLSRVFSNTTVQKHQFFSTQLSS